MMSGVVVDDIRLVGYLLAWTFEVRDSPTLAVLLQTRYLSLQPVERPVFSMPRSNVDHVVVYQDVGAGWRWRAVSANGEIVAQGEAHTRSEDAERAARGVLGQDVRVVVE